MLICRRGWTVGKNDLFPAFLCPWLILLIVIFVNQSSCRKFTAVRLQKQMPVSLTVQRKELQWNHEEEMPFFSSVSTPMLFQTKTVSMRGAQWLKVRNGQQQSGFMSTHLTRSWIRVGTVQIWMRVVRDGLPLGNAPRTESTWLELPTFLATVGGAVRYVRIDFMISMLNIHWKLPVPGVVIHIFFGGL